MEPIVIDVAKYVSFDVIGEFLSKDRYTDRYSLSMDKQSLRSTIKNNKINHSFRYIKLSDNKPDNATIFGMGHYYISYLAYEVNKETNTSKKFGFLYIVRRK